MITVSDAFKEFITLCEANGLRPHTLRFYRVQLKPFIARFGAVGLDMVTKSDVRAFVAELEARTARYTNAPQRRQVAGGLSPEAINAYIRALRVFWNFAIEDYGLDHNPTKGIKLRKGNGTIKAIKPHNFMKLLEACDTRCTPTESARNKAMLLLLADTGLRRVAVTNATLSGLDMLTRRLTVEEKGGEMHTVFFSYYTGQMIRAWLEVRKGDNDQLFTSVRTGEPLQPGAVNLIMRRLKKASGVRGATNPHAFRHGFGVEYILAGGDGTALQKLMGHKSITTTTNFYLMFDENELALLHDKVPTLDRFLA